MPLPARKKPKKTVGVIHFKDPKYEADTMSFSG